MIGGGVYPWAAANVACGHGGSHLGSSLRAFWGGSQHPDTLYTILVDEALEDILVTRAHLSAQGIVWDDLSATAYSVGALSLVSDEELCSCEHPLAGHVSLARCVTQAVWQVRFASATTPELAPGQVWVDAPSQEKSGGAWTHPVSWHVAVNGGLYRLIEIDELIDHEGTPRAHVGMLHREPSLSITGSSLIGHVTWDRSGIVGFWPHRDDLWSTPWLDASAPRSQWPQALDLLEPTLFVHE